MKVQKKNVPKMKKPVMNKAKHVNRKVMKN